MAQGHVYPSHERAVALTPMNAPQLTAVRLEGTWVVFEMTNDESFDIEVLHELRLEPPNGGDARVFEGKEVLRGEERRKATTCYRRISPTGGGDSR